MLKLTIQIKYGHYYAIRKSHQTHVTAITLGEHLHFEPNEWKEINNEHLEAFSAQHPNGETHQEFSYQLVYENLESPVITFEKDFIADRYRFSVDENLLNDFITQVRELSK